MLLIYMVLTLLSRWSVSSLDPTMVLYELDAKCTWQVRGNHFGSNYFPALALFHESPIAVDASDCPDGTQRYRLVLLSLQPPPPCYRGQRRWWCLHITITQYRFQKTYSGGCMFVYTHRIICISVWTIIVPTSLRFCRSGTFKSSGLAVRLITFLGDRRFYDCTVRLEATGRLRYQFGARALQSLPEFLTSVDM